VYHPYFISKLKSVIFDRRRYQIPTEKTKHGRSCTWNWRDKRRCQLNGFFGKILANLFSQSATLSVYLFVYLSIHNFFILLFFSAEKIFKVLV